MPHASSLATVVASAPPPVPDEPVFRGDERPAPGDLPARRLARSVSAASVSFVECGAAVADLGDLLRDLRLALRAPGASDVPPAPGAAQQEAAELLAARFDTVRRALDGATAAIDELLEDEARQDG